MGNRVYLELRGSDLPILTEEDEEAVACLTANNSLPLFWLALVREEDVGAAWEEEVAVPSRTRTTATWSRST